MNDFMEMHWGYHIWEQAASELLTQVGKPFLDEIDFVIHKSSTQALVLASCLSRHGDVLSQWRAYGQDGAGFAIGFRATALINLAIKPLQVEYNRDKQCAEIMQFISAIYDLEKTEPVPRGADFLKSCANLAFDLAAFKNPAFSEESEIRLIHLLNFKKSNASLRLVDSGGTAFNKPFDSQPINFHMVRSTPVAHIDLDFTDNGCINPICEVVLGPKNESLPSNISVFLETLDINNVNVRQSSASYR